MTNSQRLAVEQMKSMDSVTVSPDLIAQALGMNPGVLRKHVRDGDYKISAFEVFGDRIRFFRKDFLQKIGEIPEDPPEKTDSDRLEEIKTRLNSIDAKESTINMSILLKSDGMIDRLDELIELLRVQNTMLMEISAYIKGKDGANDSVVCRSDSVLCG